jgi:NO-binding membrane sensor protein with MHYT domain
MHFSLLSLWAPPAIGHDASLVILSVTIAILGAFTASVTASNAGALRPHERRLRVFMAAVTLGGSIWAMHFVGLLSIETPVNFAYNPELTALSAAIAFGGTGLAMYLLWPKTGGRRLPSAVTVLGLTIAATNYCGIAAVAGRGLQLYWFLTAIGVAFAVQVALMVLSFLASQRGVILTLIGAIGLGLSLTATHYLAVTSTAGLEETLLAIPQDPGRFSERSLAWAATVMMYLICSICLTIFVIMQFREETE